MRFEMDKLKENPKHILGILALFGMYILTEYLNPSDQKKLEITCN